MVPSPVGDLLLTSDGDALTGLYMTPHKNGPAVGADWRHDPSALPETVQQLGAYFDGELTVFDVPLAPVGGTPFQRQVWQALRDIPYGEVWSYGRLAGHLGRPTAFRAVGLANGRNPISIIVPCHRVIGADGSLVGYGGGVERKRQLLALESKASGKARLGRLF